MGPATEPAISPTRGSRGHITRAMWHTIGLLLAALLAYAVWRGYQNPDLLLDLSAWRLCRVPFALADLA